jgi:hypothetical protein
MTTLEAIKRTQAGDDDGVQSILEMIHDAERDEILQLDAVIIPEMEWGASVVIWVDDGYDTMIDTSCYGSWQTFEMATARWAQYAIETIRAAGYEVEFEVVGETT